MSLKPLSLKNFQFAGAVHMMKKIYLQAFSFLLYPQIFLSNYTICLLRLGFSAGSLTQVPQFIYRFTLFQQYNIIDLNQVPKLICQFSLFRLFTIDHTLVQQSSIIDLTQTPKLNCCFLQSSKSNRCLSLLVSFGR